MDAQTILERLNACSIPASIHEAEQLAVYHRLLLDWNTRMDLTAVTEDSEMLDRHYVDSLMALTQPGLLPVSGRVIDVGTGAAEFPFRSDCRAGTAECHPGACTCRRRRPESGTSRIV